MSKITYTFKKTDKYNILIYPKFQQQKNQITEISKICKMAKISNTSKTAKISPSGVRAFFLMLLTLWWFYWKKEKNKNRSWFIKNLTNNYISLFIFLFFFSYCNNQCDVDFNKFWFTITCIVNPCEPCDLILHIDSCIIKNHAVHIDQLNFFFFF